MITAEQYRGLAEKYGTPLYVNDKEELRANAQEVSSIMAPIGGIVRYALKANNNFGVVHEFNETGLHFDASSSFEADNLIEMGIDPCKISLSAQTLDGTELEFHKTQKVVQEGILPVATSLDQIELLGKLGVKTLGLRINPPAGSGGTRRTTTGGEESSFGIWHEYTDDAVSEAHKQGMAIDRLHTHVGSGVDPSMWREAIDQSIDIVRKLPDSVIKLDVGGGYKIARMPDEEATDMNDVFDQFSEALSDFKTETGRSLRLEIEPGTYLIASAGSFLCKIAELKDTGKNGYSFAILNTGMNDFLRTALYGAQHPIHVLSDAEEKALIVFAGHNCESSDRFTTVKGDPETVEPRLVNKPKRGDLVVIEYMGAYCASMRAHEYNSFPSAPERVV